MELLWKITPMACAQLMVMVYIFEWDGLVNVWMERSLNTITLCYIALSAVTAFLLNASNFFANRFTSPLTITVGGNIKQVCTIVLSILIFRNPVTLLSATGMTITTLGAVFYSMLKYYHL